MRRRQSEVEEHRTGEWEFRLQYKRISRMYLRLKAPDATIFVTAPYGTSLSEVEQFILRNREWIRQQKQKQVRMEQKPVRLYETGETVYVWGKAYELLLLHDQDMVRQLCGTDAAEALKKHGIPVNPACILNRSGEKPSETETEELVRGFWDRYERCIPTWLPPLLPKGGLVEIEAIASKQA